MMERVKEHLGARQSDSTTMSHLLGLLMNYATVLRAAAYHGNSPLIVALLNGGAAIDAAPSPDRYHAGSMRTLLDAGASLAPFVASGMTALEMAQLQDMPAERGLPIELQTRVRAAPARGTW